MLKAAAINSGWFAPTPTVLADKESVLRACNGKSGAGEEVRECEEGGEEEEVRVEFALDGFGETALRCPLTGCPPRCTGPICEPKNTSPEESESPGDGGPSAPVPRRTYCCCWCWCEEEEDDVGLFPLLPPPAEPPKPPNAALLLFPKCPWLIECGGGVLVIEG